MAALNKAGLPTPTVAIANLLVDTGASQTAINSSILAGLGLSPTGTQQVHTPSTQGVPHVCNTFDVGLMVHGALMSQVVHFVPALPVLDGQFKPQGVDGLLGRDVLASCRVTYSGPDQLLMVSF
jgi:hypothetical protein